RSNDQMSAIGPSASMTLWLSERCRTYPSDAISASTSADANPCGTSASNSVRRSSHTQRRCAAASRTQISQHCPYDLFLRVFERERRRPSEDCSVGERFYHVCCDEHHLVEIAPFLHLVRPRGDRQSESTMKANG